MCEIEGVTTEALWDTGAQVSMISSSWLKDNHPDISVHPIEELLDTTALNLRAANGTPLPFEGWIGLCFRLPTAGRGKSLSIQVPFLVSTSTTDDVIVGFNVIEEVLGGSQREGPSKAIFQQMSSAMPWMKKHHLKEVVNMILTEKGEDYLCKVRVGRENVVIPKQGVVEVCIGPVWPTSYLVFLDVVHPSKERRQSKGGKNVSTWLPLAMDLKRCKVFKGHWNISQ
ncbi:hypothetical protein HOLleu_21296 [Holothuria leucospilota]|uniref:Uncharacterized protein n=1 Tax=Holothuria leucospilota TaxID=206669 RepID=A0A9Q1BX99_HOLLE|nr:hypothetical protein HOLleu_21296 [Holothuria leucospilota]